MSWTQRLTLPLALALLFVANPGLVNGQETAMARMRPIGSPSAVDQFRRSAQTPSYQSSRSGANMLRARTNRPEPRNETAFWQPNRPDAGVVHTAMMQTGLDAPALQGDSSSGGIGLPPATPAPGASIPSTAPFATGAPNPNPPATTPRALPAPTAPQTVPSSPSDLTPMPQPQLNTNAFATYDNCRLITGPSTYTAAMNGGCGSPQVFPAAYGGQAGAAPPITTSPFAGVPTEYAPAAAIPPTTVVAPTTPFANRGAAPARSLFTLGQENYTVQVGQGLWGQPKAYVPGQNVRNWVRYFFP